MPDISVQAGPCPDLTVVTRHADGDQHLPAAQGHLQGVSLPLLTLVVPQGQQQAVGLQRLEPDRDGVVLQVRLLLRHHHEVLVARDLQAGGLCEVTRYITQNISLHLEL